MSVPNKFEAGALFPEVGWPVVGGGGTMNIAAMQGWRILMVYRGKHCPLCKRYFKQLNEMLADFESAGVAILAVSADPQDKAQADVEAEGWRFPVAYDLPLDDMRKLGLYISSPRSDQETDRPFAEPAMFVINRTTGSSRCRSASARIPGPTWPSCWRACPTR
ncbi:MAG: redoxin domain-containing protein [Burkholderiaceae bacterium]